MLAIAVAAHEGTLRSQEQQLVMLVEKEKQHTEELARLHEASKNAVATVVTAHEDTLIQLEEARKDLAAHEDTLLRQEELLEQLLKEKKDREEAREREIKREIN